MELAGARGGFGGFGGRLCLLPDRLEACIAKKMDVAARLMEEDMCLLERTARSRGRTREASRVIAGPDRDRRIEVVDARTG